MTSPLAKEQPESLKIPLAILRSVFCTEKSVEEKLLALKDSTLITESFILNIGV